METVQQSVVHLEHSGMPSQAQMSYAQRTTALHSRPVNHPQPVEGSLYKPQRSPAAPPSAAAYSSYPASIRFAQQQSPYGTAVPYRDNPYNIVPPSERQQPVEYVRNDSMAPQVRPPRMPSSAEYIPAVPRSRMQQVEPFQERDRERSIDLVTQTNRGECYRERERECVVVPTSVSSSMELGPSIKKIRLTEPKRDLQPQIKIDTRQEQVQVQPASVVPTSVPAAAPLTVQQPAYNPQVEAISPTLPPETIIDDADFRSTKDDLLQRISKIDRDISATEASIHALNKKKQELEEAACKPDGEKDDEEERLAQQPQHHFLGQEIYAENRRKAQKAHAELERTGPKVELPLYNQPSDTVVYHENKHKYILFKKRLLEHLRKQTKERDAREKFLAQTYSRLVQDWQRRVEKIESSGKRRAKDSKNREFFEKVFPELRKQREDKERFNRVGARIKSELEYEEVMDTLHEQEMEDKKMRSYAVIPPLLLDARQRLYSFVNNNGRIPDFVSEYKERQVLNFWTKTEIEIFKEKFIQHPKNFGVIASYLDRKSACDCVKYYYHSKKEENYKRLLRKSRQRTRASNPRGKVNNASGAGGSAGGTAGDTIDSILSSTTGVTTRLQREQLQKQEHPPVAAPLPPPAPSETLSVPPATTCDTVENSVDKDNNPSPPLLTMAVTPPPPPTSISTPASEPKLDNKKKERRKEEKKKKEEELGETTDEEMVISQDCDKGQQICIVCKSESESTRALTRSCAMQYGLREDDVPSGARVCNSCRCKSVRTRYTHCPLPSCPNAKGPRVKRLRPLPMKWPELPRHIKDPIIAEFHIPPNVTKCCSACFNRIVRKLTPLDDGSTSGSPLLRWNEAEIESLKRGLREYGNWWAEVAKVVGSSKTQHQCKNFFFNYNKKFGLDQILQEYNKNHMGEERKPTLTDEEESGSSTSSCDEIARSGLAQDSDTASAGSPTQISHQTVTADGKDKSSEEVESGPPVLLPQKEDYDSSATVQPPLNRERETDGTLDLSIKKNRPEYRDKHSPLAPPQSVTVYRTAATHTEPPYYHQGVTGPLPSKLSSPGLLNTGVGSILHGTPVSSPSLYNASSQAQTPSSRYEMRQMTPPHVTKEASAGSITQGTPVHQRGVYQGTGSTNEWGSKRAPVSGQGFYPPRTPAYAVEQRQIIMNDYITSQQMHGTATRRSSEKPSSLYYQPRQGVIQRHNTKPPSPHQYLPGHEALSSLVDVAVRLPSLPVPDHKESSDKRLLHEGLGERFNRDNSQERFSSSRDQDRFTRENHQIHHRPLSDNHLQQQQIQQQQRELHQQQQQQIREHQIHQPIHHHREMERQHREHQLQHLQLQQHQRDILHHKQLRENQIQHQMQQQQRERDIERLSRLSYPTHREELPPSRLMAFRDQNPAPTARSHQVPSREGSPAVSGSSGSGRSSSSQRGDSSTLTAASLIDAIITHQINQTSNDSQVQGAATNANSNQQHVTRPGDRLFQGFHREPTEANGKLSPLKSSGMQMTGSPDPKQNSMSLGDHIESIINKDYPPTSRHTQFQGYEQSAWKLRRALQQKELDQSQVLREKNDERNIVRMAGPPSPRGLRYYDAPTVPLSPLDYVKNRIVEVMRTSEEEGVSKSVGDDSPGGGDMVIDEGEELPPQATTPFIATSGAYAYPFSALSLNTTPQTVPVPVSNTAAKQPVPATDSLPEPAPLLSAQYEPLSDED